MSAEKLKDFGPLLEPALEQGFLTPAQAWSLQWDSLENPDDPFPPHLASLWLKATLARLDPEAGRLLS